MKKFLLAISLLVATNTYAIDEQAKLADTQKSVVSRIKNSLQISEIDAYKVYKSTMENWTSEKEDTDWFYTSIDNETLSAAKFKNSSTRFLQFNLANNNKLVNVTLIAMPGTNQIYVQTHETLPRTASLVIDKQSELKKDKNYDKKTDKAQYSIFSKKEKASEIILFANNGVGAVQFSESFLIDVTNKSE